MSRYPGSGLTRGSVEVLSSTKFPLNSCGQSGKSSNRPLRSSSSSSFLFAVSAGSCNGFPRNSELILPLLYCCWIFRADHWILWRRCWRSRGEDDVEELVCKPGTTSGRLFATLQSILLPFWVRCGFLTAGPVVGIPLILAELPERKDCGSLFKKHNLHEWVQFFDTYRGFFSCLHLAVGRHHRRRTSRCPHDLQQQS